jgi:hypothetical protein
MAKRTIRVVYGCWCTKRPYDSPEYAAWLEGVRRAFAGLGWSVTGQGPTMSSTNVEEDELGLESDGAPLDRAALEAALARAGIDPHYCSGDIAEPAEPRVADVRRPLS